MFCGTGEERGGVYLHKEAYHANYSGGMEDGRSQKELGREPDKPGQPSPIALVSLFPTTAWPDSSAYFPGESLGLVIARSELGGEWGKRAQPDPNSLGCLALTEEDSDFLTSSNKVQEGLVSGPLKHHLKQG